MYVRVLFFCVFNFQCFQRVFNLLPVLIFSLKIASKLVEVTVD